MNALSSTSSPQSGSPVQAHRAPYTSPAIFFPYPNLIAAESTRHGGVSAAPFDSLNLGLSSGDGREAVLENRKIFFGALHISLSEAVLSHQVHGDAVLQAEAAGHFEGYDALITNRKNLFLAVSVADCVPLLLYDTAHHAVAAVHAGWRGTVKQIVRKTVEAMQRQFHTEPADCVAYIGTCIDECAFEVGEDVASQFDTPFKTQGDGDGKFFVNLKAANRAQLEAAGVLSGRIETSPYSTVQHSLDYFSYRLASQRGLQTGRMMAVIGLR